MHFLLIGCGKMGYALMRGWGHHANATSIVAIDPTEPPCDVLEIAGVSWFSSADSLLPGYHPDAIILAVKPQDMAAVLPRYAKFINSVFLSIAAGQTLKRLDTLLGGNHAIARAMPNLPAAIGQGISVAVANPHVTESQHKLCEILLKAAGDVVWTEDEALLSTVTALSGCGPAYVFLLCEAMEAAGVKLGLPADMARILARQTVIGSAALMDQSISSAQSLRQAVTSPGGSTAEAMKHLLGENGLFDLMLRAMRAAAERTKEMDQ